MGSGNSSSRPQRSQEQYQPQSRHGERPLTRYQPGSPEELRLRRRERDANAEHLRPPLAPLSMRSRYVEVDRMPVVPPLPLSPRSIHEVGTPSFRRKTNFTTVLKTKHGNRKSLHQKPLSSKRRLQKVSAVATGKRRGLSLTCESCRRGDLVLSKRQIQSRVSEMDARTSIARGILHLQSCNGCSRPLCLSTRKLIRRCAAHAQQCRVLSCSECTACNVSRMVQVALRGGPEVNCVQNCVQNEALKLPLR